MKLRKLRKLLAIMNPFDKIEIVSIHNTEQTLFQGEIKNVPYYLTKCRICIDKETLEFCYVSADKLVVFVDD